MTGIHRPRLGSYGSVVIVLLAVSTSPAIAHTSGSGGGFTAGLAHPVGGADHVLAMIAVGLWGAQLGRPALWLLPIAFPLMMACGAALGLMGFALPGVEIGIALSAIALGSVVMLEARPPPAWALAMVAFFAIFHGHAHGTELPEGQSGLLYSIGFVIATGLLHGIGIGIGSVHRWKAGQVLLRLAGAVVFVCGLLFLGKSTGVLGCIASPLFVGFPLTPQWVWFPG